MTLFNRISRDWEGTMIIGALKITFVSICICAAILVSVVATYGNI